MKNKKSKEKGELGRFIQRYEQARYPAFWVMTGAIFVIALFVLDVLIFNWNVIFGLIGFFLLALLVAGIITGEMLQKIWPRKDLLVYENGIELASKNEIESYHWRRFETIHVRIIRSKRAQELIGHAYYFGLSNGQEFVIGISEYPEMGERLTNVLLQHAHEIVTFNDVLQ